LPDGSPYLVDAVDLRRAFRRHFLKGLCRLFERGELKLEGEFVHLQQRSQWEDLLEELKETEWVSYIEPPPTSDCRPQHVLKYLARYLTGGPISDARIIACDNDEVTFWAREGKTIGGDRAQIPITLPIEEFTRRWSLHILPKGYTKVRRFGGWSNRSAGDYVERSAIQLESIDAPLSEEAIHFGPFTETESVSEDSDDTNGCCPECGGLLYVVAENAKPAWHEVMNSASRPNWYARDNIRWPKTLHRPAAIE
jgi:hypothetical protein